jgi:hypothetical protein
MTSLLDFVLYPGSNHYVKDVHVFAMRYPETYRLMHLPPYFIFYPSLSLAALCITSSGKIAVHEQSDQKSRRIFINTHSNPQAVFSKIRFLNLYIKSKL